jgi:ligand-binding SRPBCC domain-containing protein
MSLPPLATLFVAFLARDAGPRVFLPTFADAIACIRQVAADEGLLTMTKRRLTTAIEVPAALDEVFGFFSSPQNLRLLTPPDLDFQIKTPMPTEMHAGLRIDYRLRVRRIPVGWSSEISLWDPPYGFVDEQRRGPYRHWRHLHRFHPTLQGTRVTDIVDYSLPGWILAGLLHRVFVRPDLERIFRYRLDRIGALFGVVGEPGQPEFKVVRGHAREAVSDEDDSTILHGES